MQSNPIREQIQQLRHKQHIDNITELRQNQYQISYSPQLTNSPYAHLTYSLRISLPHKYPQLPPRLAFTDKIYHLNVDPVTGAVSMPLLSDDWSPFLTLTAVLDSLDSLLQQPDLKYAASPILRDEYTNEPEKYLQKIQQMTRMSQAISKDYGEQSLVEQVYEVTDQEGKDMHQSDSIPEFQHLDIPANFQKSIALSQIPHKKSGKGILRQNSKGRQIKIETGSHVQKMDIQCIKEEPNQESPRKIPNHLIATSAVKEMDKIKLIQQTNLAIRQSSQASDTQYEQIQLNLKRTDSLVQLLITESNSMEDSLKKCQNSRLKAMLQKKQERILQIFEQTLQLSSQLRQKLFVFLKSQTKRLLK